MDDALSALRQTLGAEQVKAGADLSGYRDPYSFSSDSDADALAAVLPADVAEVQSVLAIARASRIPVWTVSRGRNFGYGGAAARVPGSIIVDLQRMNRVLEVDVECAAALVEPGVSFEALSSHLRTLGAPLWPSVPDISWGSVVGNALERGFGYTAYGQHEAQVCGLEVVLADGSVVRTGMGAVPGAKLWSLYRGGYGPSVEGLFSQSNLGVVTKMGVWLMPRPERAAACGLHAQNDADLGPLVDVLLPLLLDGTIQSNVIIGNTAVIASMMSERTRWADGDAPMADAEIARMAEGLGLGRWNARFGVYGDAAMVAARLARVRRAFERLSGVKFVVREYDGDVAPEAVHPADRAQLGVPSTDLVRMGAWRARQPAHTDFSLVCPPKGADAVNVMRVIRGEVERAGFDYAGGFTLFPRHAIALALVAFDRENQTQCESVPKLMRRLLALSREHGLAPYRSHTAFMDDTARSYDEGGLRGLKELLKDALDPTGVLSPGKQGVWPGRSRLGQ